LRFAVERAAVELLEPRIVLAAGLEISEFMAKNDNGLKDEEGIRRDWIEIHNNSSQTIDLAGYHLTDDPGELNMWTFPSVQLDPDEYLVVFASEKDRRDPAGTLHTNFKLNEDGDYLALVAPDLAVVQDFGPQYPPQIADVSYGVAVQTQSSPLTTASATPRVKVPTAADAPLGTGWTARDYNDSSWTLGGLGVGYEKDPVPQPGPAGFNVRMLDASSGSFADIGTAKAVLGGNTAGFTFASDTTIVSQDIDFAGPGGRYANNRNLPNGFGVANASNVPEREQYAMRMTAYVTIPAGTYTVGVNSDDGFQLTIPGVTFTSRVNENYTGGTSGPDQITFGAPRGPADTLGTFTVGAGGLATTMTLDFYEQGGGDSVELFVGRGAFSSWSAANFTLLSNGAFGWGVFTTAPPPHYASLIKTDVGAQMFNVGTSAWMRIPFNLEADGEYTGLRVRMKYDDGFVAFINGHRFAWRNFADADPLWDAASNKNRVDSDALVYETITVPGLSQYLKAGVNILAIQGLNVSTGSSDFLIIPELDGIRTTSSGVSYFATPTPGGLNSNAVLGKVTDTKFSKDRGFYDQPFQVRITNDTAGATIRYTLDGSAPTATAGLVYTGPITISTTSVLRAAAFKTGYQSSDVDTQTYLFLKDVIKQPGTVPTGYPSTWNGFPADYEMDPNVVNDPAYSGQILDGLKSIPSLSLVLNKDDMFGPQGLYVNLSGTGVQWERPTSVEMLYPDGRDAMQVNAGLRIQGGAGRNPSLVTKHSFRLVFSARTGPTRLEFPFFDGSRVTSFDTITLRAGFNNSWNFTNTSEQQRATYLEDEWMRITQRAMGQVSGYGNFVHLYINGMYWGLYNPTERPSAPFAADWYGGEKEDWDDLNSSEAIDGDKTAWNTLQSLANGPGGASAPTANWLADNANYEAVKQYLDVDNLIDYMLINFYGGNQDWDDHNWYAARRRAPGEGYKFFSWDGERTLESTTANKTGVNQADKPSRLYAQLRANADFRLLFADHIQKHFFNGGALTPAVAAQRFADLAAIIDKAIIGESARWGDSRREPPYTRNAEWLTEKNRKLNQYFPVRTANVLTQLKGLGLYPGVDAPTLNKFGGDITSGFALTMTNPMANGGVIYYTTDGSDPRVPVTGAVSPSALVYSGPIQLTASTRIKARILAAGTWSALDDATFNIVPPPTVRVTEIMYHPTDPPVGSVYTKDDFEYVEVMNGGTAAVNLNGMRFTDGINFTFGATTLGPGERTVIVKNLTAFQSRYGTNVATAGVYTDQLNNAGEKLRLETALGQVIEEFSYDDDWFKQTDGQGYSLVAVDPMAANLVLSSQEGWRASTKASGAPGLADPGFNNNSIVINEVLAKPGPNDAATGDWIELRNTTTGDINVGGWWLSDSATDRTKYRIAANTIIPAGGYLVLNQVHDFGSPAIGTPFSLGDNGGAAFLTADDGAGDPGGYRDSVDFGASDAGVTFGRFIKSTGRSDFVALVGPTPGANNAAPRIGPVIINEIMYNPAGFGIEYVELRNLSGSAVPLFDPSRPQNRWKFTDGIVFDFPDGASMPGNGYALVVATDPAEFRAAYPGIPEGVPVWGPFTGSLDNAGESLELSRPGEPDPLDPTNVPYIRADKIVFDGKTPWPSTPNGQGPSLARKLTSGYGNDPANWQVFSSGGTPGLVNNAIAPVVSAGANATADAGKPFVRNGSFTDASAGETWSAVVTWGDSTPTEPLALNADKTFSLNHTYAKAGVYDVVVRVTDSAGAFGIATFRVTAVDTTGPTVTSPGFAWQAAPNKLTFTFSEDVSASLGTSDLQLVNLTTGQPITPINASLDYDDQTFTATFTWPGMPDGVLPDGRYRATLIAAGVSDPTGNVMDGDNDGVVGGNFVFDFFSLAADANHDAQVDHEDFAILNANFGQSNKDASQGDFNHDGTVDFKDFQLLELAFGSQLAAAAPVASPAPTPVPVTPVPVPAPKPVKKKTAFSQTRIDLSPAPAPKPKPPAKRAAPARR
jgi:hypothetical protein